MKALARLFLPLHDVCNMEIGCWAPRGWQENSKRAGGDHTSSTGHSNAGSAAPPGYTLGLLAKSKTDQFHPNATIMARQSGTELRWHCGTNPQNATTPIGDKVRWELITIPERRWTSLAEAVPRAEFALVIAHLIFSAVGRERTRAQSILVLISGLTPLMIRFVP